MIDKKRGVILVADIPLDARENRNEPEIYRYCRQFTDISKKAHESWLNKIESDPSIQMFGIRTPLTQDSVGVCGFSSIDRLNQSAEFSLYINPKHQKKGLGMKSLLTLLEHGFFDFNLNRIWGESYSFNPALKMFDAIGMTREGCLRESYYRSGKFEDSILVSMLRGEFRRFHPECF